MGTLPGIGCAFQDATKREVPTLATCSDSHEQQYWWSGSSKNISSFCTTLARISLIG